MKLLACFRTVLWSFLGIRRSAAAVEGIAKVEPPGLPGAATVVFAIFGLTLSGLANLAVSTLK